MKEKRGEVGCSRNNQQSVRPTVIAIVWEPPHELTEPASASHRSLSRASSSRLRACGAPSPSPRSRGPVPPPAVALPTCLVLERRPRPSSPARPGVLVVAVEPKRRLLLFLLEPQSPPPPPGRQPLRTSVGLRLVEGVIFSAFFPSGFWPLLLSG
uniref:Uncharacterized protein n=1 Tax=Oryza brachyantha TaxID=4533 RepID=J3L596_ORYBR